MGTRGPRGARTPEYYAWTSMRQRCKNPQNCNFKHYGARGISVCARWDSFDNFISDMGSRPDKYHSLERVDVNGNYEPENCVWLPNRLQARNKTNTRLVRHQGVLMPLVEACEKSGISKDTILHRVARGLSYEEALTTQMPRGPKCVQLFELHGERVTMRRLMEISGKSRGALQYLIVTAGYSPEQAIQK